MFYIYNFVLCCSSCPRNQSMFCTTPHLLLAYGREEILVLTVEEGYSMVLTVELCIVERILCCVVIDI